MSNLLTIISRSASSGFRQTVPTAVAIGCLKRMNPVHFRHCADSSISLTLTWATVGDSIHPTA